MKTIIISFKLFAFLMLLSVMGFAQNQATPAFPGADGHARFVTGGRGGQIIYVTHLNDDYTMGSLRTAIGASGSRVVVFKVSGTIHLKSELKINNSNITIAGQTAPGDGITLAGYPVSVGADNVIIRFIRFRMGDTANIEGDAIGGRFKKNIMIDHCSMSWSTDECVSFYQNETFTLQWCIISESLRNSAHDKGSHGYGGIWGGKNASFHHNLLAHHDSRNPRLGEYAGDAFALTDAVDLRNNVIYNWQGNSCYGGEAMNVNIVNCYYKPGPATTKKERIVSIDKYTRDESKPIYNVWGKFFVDGNVLEASERATNDNWTYGVFNQFHGSYGFVSAEEKASIKVEKPHPTGYVHTHSAEMAFEKVLDYAGASFVRDTIDKRVTHDVRTGTATFMDGGNGSVNGIIDTQETVGGWPELTSTEAPVDTDEDGMPDEWETANGLNPNDKNDAWLNSLDDQYPNVEVYLNSIVSHIIDAQIEDAELVFVDENTSSGKMTTSPDKYRAFYNSDTKSIVVSGSSIMRMVEVYSTSGSLIDRIRINSNHAEIPMAGCDSSLYIVRVTDENDLVQSKKIVAY